MRQRKIKVAVICQPWDSFVPPVQSGSIPIWTYEVIRHLRDRCAFVVYSKKKNGQRAEEIVEGITCRRIPIEIDTFSHKILRRLPFADTSSRPFFSQPLYHWSYISRIARDLRRRNCDIVHIMNFSQFVPVIRFRNPGIKIVLNMRCEWLTQLSSVMVEKRLDKTDLVVGCSDYITNLIRRSYPGFEKRCETVVNGVNPEQWISAEKRTSTDKEIRLLFVGRLSPEKGLHVLLDAFEKVWRLHPQVRLEMAGPEGSAPIDFIVKRSDDERIRNLASFYEGNYLAYLKKKISVEYADRVRFTGFIPHDQLIDHYTEADILVNPSFSESFGRSLIEAMACELPVIASRVGGMQDIVEDERTGLLVEAGDADALARAIQRLIVNRELRRSMGEAGRMRVIERYSWKQVAESMLQKYEEVQGLKQSCRMA